MSDDPRAGALEIGERLSQSPSARLVALAFSEELDAQMGLAEMVGWVDLAHTLCLADAGVIPQAPARELIGALLDLQRAGDFEPGPEFGDLYTNREAWLTRKTAAAGWLGVARARREALTTAYHLKVCDALCNLCDALATAVEASSAVSRRHKDSVMPDYTYLQAAQPTTFGHYLQSFAWPLLRDWDRATELHARMNQCPAGIGSANGSVIAQDRWAIARRLGFTEPVRHARDAMWMHDLAIEACAIAVSVCVNLSRLAEDLMIFASAEFGFVRLADGHSRASKIMPQKRNPFALAFARATANRLLGVQAGVAAAGRTPSGQMDNRLYAYGAIPEALRAAGEAALLVAECVDDLEFNQKRALQALEDRGVCAADLAERLTAEAKIDYRRAHGAVGRLVANLEAQGRTLADATPEDLGAALRSAGAGEEVINTADILALALDLTRCVGARKDVGCASPKEMAAMAEELSRAARERRGQIAQRRADRKAAIDALFAEARSFAGDAR
ncbi:argininosuccinate lyase [Methylocystis sp. Sn-Cys]|uniref:argininosuccinate lyase n=1 Tax=Methylocystis sp. Sn-Cys TaxID=1701263 RepID=UPI0019248698|nr:lyase family protein [Methylocystis sp. Sn-Cys]MBL1258285.1 argininosuccinate lyase [Methylocystis sp. Sn-Cys]